jgi:hypothetical protein
MSEVKVNKISPRTNCGTVTLGDSGDAFTIPAGVTITNNGTQTGFGREGSVDWQTSSIKTGDFTAVSGEGYFVNTTSGTITVTLPSSPSGGAIVAIKDYAQTFNTNNCTIARNGSNIEGAAANATLDGKAESVTFVYVDSTKGWVLVSESTSLYGPAFISATGGTITTSGNFKIHTFTGPGTFCVSNAGNSVGSNTVDYLVIAGGGGGGDAGDRGSGGGGAGGYRESSGAASGCYTRSPLGACVSALPVSAQGYPITVGAGGCGTATNPQDAGNGSNSIFSSITATGGGGGGACCSAAPRGRSGSPGGSGGGAGASGSTGTAGNGNTPPVTPAQGQNGGNAHCAGNSNTTGGGGGGATVAGGNGASANAGNGGNGATSCITASPVTRAGGGGAGGGTDAGTGGTGGGGNGNTWPGSPSGGTAGNGTVNTGSGGGGASTNCGGGNGGSGIVIIRYKFQ